MGKLIKTGIVALTGAFAIGALGLTAAAADAGDQQLAKREDLAGQAVVADDSDDDNDDTNDDTRSRAGKGSRDATNNSRASRFSRDTGPSRDNTNSRHTGVSRDRDRSRGDLTRDRTADGPGTDNRDFSRDSTNDRSRNDTR